MSTNVLPFTRWTARIVPDTVVVVEVAAHQLLAKTPQVYMNDVYCNNITNEFQHVFMCLNQIQFMCEDRIILKHLITILLYAEPTNIWFYMLSYAVFVQSLLYSRWFMNHHRKLKVIRWLCVNHYTKWVQASSNNHIDHHSSRLVIPMATTADTHTTICQLWVVIDFLNSIDICISRI